MSHDQRGRASGRAENALRPVQFELGVAKFAEGSALIATGDTRVLVTASVEKRVPGFLVGSGKGWLTAEYAMLPRATSTRSQREVTRGRPSGRSSEIQRLIGRALRAAIDLERLGELTITIDCDVLQADAGTRTASITGGWVAAVDALAKLYLAGDLARWPIVAQVAAVSVGRVAGRPLLDLDYPEDQGAEVDLNVVATVDGRLVEVQGTAEQKTFTRDELDELLDLAMGGIATLGHHQRTALADPLALVEERLARGARPAPVTQNERSVWGPPKKPA